jgi:2,4-dienoyl-CoA reductase-like NADH-dependent reductase (Old Yellow Enzyme family)/thioredoxin reductase
MERKALFEPLPLGAIRLKNRLVMAPMVTNYASPTGEVTERLLDYHAERSRGGVGLIIVEATCVAFPLGVIFQDQLRADDDRFLPGLEALARRVRADGAAALLQLCHGGRVALSRLYGQVPLAPSSIAPPGGDFPRGLTTGEISEIVASFAGAAKRAQKAGFDGVEVHAAHSYLLNQFLSPAANQRQDGYGGELKSRARMVLEVLRETRREVGPGFLISCRINGAEFGLPDGITTQDSQDLTPLLEEAGADIIHVSAFGYDHPVMRASAPSEPGFELSLAEGIKKRARVPVIAVGRLTPALAETAVREGKTDLVAFARALLADPQLPNKIALGREEDICPCINCYRCRDGVAAGKPVLCPVNPALGRERELSLSPARQRQKVLMVGGGVAGMEAARVAALRGHQVWLYEKAKTLGGQLGVASKPPEKQDLDRLSAYLQAQIKKLPVRVKRGKAVTPEVVEALGPQAVVLAMGSAPFLPVIPGIDQGPVVLAEQVLRGKAVVGERVVVIGGETVGCETADFLAQKGKKVTVVRREEGFATRISPTNRQALLARLAQKEVELLAGASYQGITPEGLLIRDGEGRERLLEADTIVIAAGALPQDGLAQALEGKVPQLHRVGDCVEPRSIQEAMAEAYSVALRL